jgi:hypothetical protein
MTYARAPVRPVVNLCLLAVLLGALLFLRCGGEWNFVIPDWDAGRPSSRFAGECAQWAESLCNYEDRCPSPIYFRWTSHAQCVDRSMIECELAANDPNVAFDADLVAACSYPSDCSSPLPPQLCLARSGHAQAGSPCTGRLDCASSMCEYSFDQSTGSWGSCGVCARACDLTCEDGGVCTYEEDGGIGCASLPTFVAVGQPCGPSDECAGGYCRLDASGKAGTCTAFAKAGESCGDGKTGPPCTGADTNCDDSHRCSVSLPAGYGEPCATAPGAAARSCIAYGWCDVTSGRCVPPAPDGALCDPAQGLGCLPPAACIGYHCLFPTLADCSF